MAIEPIFVGGFRNQIERLNAVDNIGPTEICTGGPNGSRLHALQAVSTDAGANTLFMYGGHLRTLGTAMGTISYTNTTLTRTLGSYIDDGWRVGDMLIVTGTRGRTGGGTNANFIANITGVTATVLTYTTIALTTSGSTSLNPERLKLHNSVQLSLTSLPANVGNTTGTSAVDILTDSKPMVDTSPDRFLMLPNDWSLFARITTVLAAAKSVEFWASLGDY